MEKSEILKKVGKRIKEVRLQKGISQADLVGRMEGNIDATKVQVQDRISQLQHGFMAKGFSSNEALDKAHKIIDLSITKQSTVLAYMDIFLFLGILFLICIPIILLIKNNKNKVNISEAMH